MPDAFTDPDHYVREIVHQWRLTAIAYDRLEEALSELGSANIKVGQVAHVAVFASLQAILTASGQISRLLWPDVKSPSQWDQEKIAYVCARGEALRDITQVSKNSLLKRRSVRNAIEHFDDRLDDFYLSGHTSMADNNIGPIGAFSIGDGAFLRHYDPATTEYSAINAGEVSIRDLVDEIATVGDKAQMWYFAKTGF